MRVNVYNEELLDEVEVVRITPRPNRTFIGVRFMLASSEKLHHTAEDDDRSAVTFWFGSYERAHRMLDRVIEALEKDESHARRPS